MAYTINRMIPDTGIDVVDARTRTALADYGFGVLTEIDVKASMQAIENAELTAVAGEVRDLLAKAVAAI